MDSAEDDALEHPDRCVVQSQLKMMHSHTNKCVVQIQLKMHIHTLTGVSGFPSPKLAAMVKGVHFEKGPTRGASNIGHIENKTSILLNK